MLKVSREAFICLATISLIIAFCGCGSNPVASVAPGTEYCQLARLCHPSRKRCLLTARSHGSG